MGDEDTRLEFPTVSGYAIRQLLGRGAFGAVYLAHDEGLKRDVAIKIGKPSVDADSVLLESRIAARLSGHPNVLPIYTVGVLDNGSPYVVMALADGGTLADRVGRIDVGEAGRIGVRLSGALASLNVLGLIHGDVKPENVVFNEVGEPQLADFGLTTSFDEALGTVEVPRGLTVAYAPPEVILEDRVAASVDVYALGLTLVVAVLGTNPQEKLIRANALFDVVDGGVLQEVSRSRKLAPLKDPLLAALSPDDAKRPSARDFGLLLQDACFALTGERPAMTILEPSARSSKQSTKGDADKSEDEILLQSIATSDRSVFRVAQEIETRRGNRYWSATTALLGVAAATVSVAQSLAETAWERLVSRETLLSLAVAAGAAVVTALVVRLIVSLRDNRNSSASKQALEISARLRNAYLSEIRLLRVRQFRPDDLEFSVERF